MRNIDQLLSHFNLVSDKFPPYFCIVKLNYKLKNKKLKVMNTKSIFLATAITILAMTNGQVFGQSSSTENNANERRTTSHSHSHSHSTSHANGVNVDYSYSYSYSYTEPVSTVYGGIKIDANLSNFILGDMPGMKSKMGFGITAGGYTKIEFSRNFALQPEILLHYKNSTMETKATGGEVDFQYFGVELPLYVMGQMSLGKGKGFIGIGPYVGFGIDARYKTDGADDVKLYKEYNGRESEMQRWDFGVGTMLGYEFNSRLQISATYKIGFINSLNAEKDNASMLPQTISLGLGYRF
jgi:hypothetical protein